jgi:hypothetical protein
LRSAEGALVPALVSYAAQEFGNEFFGEAWDEFFLWTNVPDDIENSKEFGTTFDPFFVFDFVPDAAEDPLPDGWPTEPLALHFLHNEVESAPELHREFIEQACKSPASFFVVETVSAGRALDIKDTSPRVDSTCSNKAPRAPCTSAMCSSCGSSRQAVGAS